MTLPSSNQDLSVLNIAQSSIALKPNSIHKKHISTLSFTFREEGGCILAWFACLFGSHRTGVWVNVGVTGKMGKCGSQCLSIHSVKPEKWSFYGWSCDAEDARKGPKDLNKRGKVGKKCIAGGQVGEILFDVPAPAESSEDKRLPETNKLWLPVSQQSYSLTEKTNV